MTARPDRPPPPRRRRLHPDRAAGRHRDHRHPGRAARPGHRRRRPDRQRGPGHRRDQPARPVARQLQGQVRRLPAEPDHPERGRLLRRLGTTTGDDLRQLSGRSSRSSAAPDPDRHARPAYAQLAERSLRYLRKFFPRANFSTTGPVLPANADANFHDFNGNGQLDDARRSSSKATSASSSSSAASRTSTGTAVTRHGRASAQNPVNPFSATAVAQHQPRRGPLFEFKADRLIDDDGDGIPGYVDTLGTRRRRPATSPTSAPTAAAATTQRRELRRSTSHRRRRRPHRSPSGSTSASATAVTGNRVSTRRPRTPTPAARRGPPARRRLVSEPADLPDHLGRPRPATTASAASTCRDGDSAAASATTSGTRRRSTDPGTDGVRERADNLTNFSDAAKLD